MILLNNQSPKFKCGFFDTRVNYYINSNYDIDKDLILKFINKDYNPKIIINILKSELYDNSMHISSDEINIYGKTHEDNMILLTNLLSMQEKQDIHSNQIISDIPKTIHREFMLDIARHFFPCNEIKKIIDELYRNRINYLHLHFSDDDNYAIESKMYPELNTKEYLSYDEIKDLVSYAKKLGIEIIPEFDTPGHLNHLLNIKNHIRCYKRKGNSLCFGKNTDIIFDLIDEICELFPCRYFHIGGDEIDLSHQYKCGICKNQIIQNNFMSHYDLVTNYINNIANYLNSIGRTVIVWNDILKYGEVNEDIIIQKWINGGHNKNINNHKVIISSTVDNYFDYPYSLIPLKRTYNYIPEVNNKEVDTYLGLSSHLWTEHIDSIEKLEGHIFPRVQAFGENAWLENSNLDYDYFLERMKKEMHRLQERDVFCEKLDKVDLMELREVLSFIKEKMSRENYGKVNYIDLLKIINGLAVQPKVKKIKR